MSKNRFLLFVFFALFAFAAMPPANAQDSVRAASSEITSAVLPGGAERILPGKVPAEFDQLFDEFLRQGAGKIAGARREVLVWLGDYESTAKAAEMTNLLEANFRGAGWLYEPHGKQGGVDVFLLQKDDSSPRRVVVGFIVPGKDALVCALMELSLPGEKTSVRKTSTGQPTTETSASAKIVTVNQQTSWVNLMGDEMPAMPQFPAVAKKAGYIRGYVKNTRGEPIVGAKLGLKTARMYDAYLAASAETDAKGYYEIKIPAGGARFDYAGYTIRYGAGSAAIGLHPADGVLEESYPAATGGVENFVLLFYGIANREDVGNNPHYRSNYYGGSFLIRYFIGGFSGMLAAGTKIEITLAPEGALVDGSRGKNFVISKTVEDSSLGEFVINNVPVGRYRIEIKQNGKPLKMTQKSSTDAVFGIQPKEATGGATLVFNPLSSDAKTAAASRGNWTDLEIIVRP